MIVLLSIGIYCLIGYALGPSNEAIETLLEEVFSEEPDPVKRNLMRSRKSMTKVIFWLEWILVWPFSYLRYFFSLLFKKPR